jgi:hypothetical protein
MDAVCAKGGMTLSQSPTPQLPHHKLIALVWKERARARRARALDGRRRGEPLTGDSDFCQLP